VYLIVGPSHCIIRAGVRDIFRMRDMHKLKSATCGVHSEAPIVRGVSRTWSHLAATMANWLYTVYSV